MGATVPRELTPEQRTLRARMAAYAMHAKYDSREITAKARQAFADKFYDATDPTLPEPERQRRAEMLKKQHMAGLRYRASLKRSRKPAPDAETARRTSVRRLVRAR
jgi:hypothetical protein